MVTYAGMSSSDEVTLNVTVPDGRIYTETKRKVEVEVGDVLRSMQKFCDLSNQIAQCCSLYTIQEVSSGSVQFSQKVFVDQRISSRKILDHFKYKENIWKLNYGLKFYPVNDLSRDWMDDSGRMLYIHQIHQDIEAEFITVKNCTTDDVKMILMLMGKASGFKLNRKLVFCRNMKCKHIMTEITESDAEGQLPELDEWQTFLELHKQISILPGYGKHPFIAEKFLRKEIEKVVILSSAFRGICIEDHHDVGSQEVLAWDNVYKVSYKASKLIIKYTETSGKVRSHRVFGK